MIEGIDVAHWQSRVDWQQVKDAGISFAWLKASGAATGALFVDPQYQRNRAETRRVGIHAGPYHFYLSNVGGAEQARHFRRCAGPSAPGDLRAALDLEDPPGGVIRLPRIECRMLVQETAQQFGHLPVIYLGESLFARFPWLVEELAGCPLWIPNWSRKPTRPHEVHQYTDKRPIPGRAPVDGNRAISLARVLIPSTTQEIDVLSPEDHAALQRIGGEAAAAATAAKAAASRLDAVLAATAKLSALGSRYVRAIGDPEGAVWVVAPLGAFRVWVSDGALLANLQRTFPAEVQDWNAEDIDKIPVLPGTPVP